MSDWPWVVGSYGLTWLVLGFYVLTVHRRLQRAREELQAARDDENRTTEVQG